MSEARVIVVGVDTLHGGFRGPLRERTKRHVDQAVHHARHDRSRGVVDLAGLAWSVKRGTAWTRAVLEREDMRMLVVRDGLPKNPELSFEFTAQSLWSVGWRGMVERAAQVCAHRDLFEVAPKGFKVSRIDLCADVMGADFARADREDFVTKMARTAERGGGKESESDTAKREEVAWERWFTSAHPNSLRWGAGHTVVRAYDKRREIRESSRKFWQEHLWAEALGAVVMHQAGGVLPESVWRVEAQLRRKALKGEAELADGRRLPIDDPDGLEATIPLVWRRIMGERLRWTEPHGANRARWPTRPEWDAIAGADWSHVSRFEGREWIPDEQRSADAESLVPLIGGVVAAWAARVGIADRVEAFREAGRVYERYLRTKGETFSGVVETKAREVHSAMVKAVEKITRDREAVA